MNSFDMVLSDSYHAAIAQVDWSVFLSTFDPQPVTVKRDGKSYNALRWQGEFFTVNRSFDKWLQKNTFNPLLTYTQIHRDDTVTLTVELDENAPPRQLNLL